MSKPIVVDRGILDSLRAQAESVRWESQDQWDIEPEGWAMYNMDAIEFLARLKPGLQLIFTDEPYGLEDQGTIAFYGKRKDMVNTFAWDEDLPAHLTMPWVYLAADKLAEGGSLACFGIGSWVTSFESVCTDAGLKLRANIPWIKKNPVTRVRLKSGGWRSGWEHLWIASKGPMRHFNQGQKPNQQEIINWEVECDCPKCGAVFPLVYSKKYGLDQSPWAHGVEWSSLTPNDERYGHGTEKPEWLAAKYLHLLSQPGDLVVDPFCGAGSILKAAYKSGRRVAGNDLEERWYAMLSKHFERHQRSIFHEQLYQQGG